MIDTHHAGSLAVSYGHECFHGLHEIVWGLSFSHPDATPAQRLQAAQSAMLSLVSRGLAQIYAAPVPFENPAPVEFASIEQLLTAPDSWFPPNERSAPHYCFATTECGGCAYLPGELTSLYTAEA